jgi:hypothetical protein
MHLTRFHGAFAPRSKLRRAIARWVPGTSTIQPPAPSTTTITTTPPPPPDDEPETGWNKRRRLGWAKLLARVFQIDVTVCADPACGGKAAIIAWITEPDVIDRILRHLGIEPTAPVTAPARAPPQSELDFGYPD